MDKLEHTLSKSISTFLKSNFDLTVDHFEFQLTRKDFEGDLTLVLFPMLKQTRTSPQVLGEKLGAYLIEHSDVVENFNVVSGFLNLSISDAHYLAFLKHLLSEDGYGHTKANSDAPTLMVEYSSPNTNKPLHLGHIRNNLLGYSISKILEANGKKVIHRTHLTFENHILLLFYSHQIVHLRHRRLIPYGNLLLLAFLP